MNVIAAIISGLAGTLAMSALMAMAPAMGMPKMDIVGMLSTMFGRANRALGWALHLMMGSAFALIYALLWSLGIGAPTVPFAVGFGAAHWALVGLGMSMVPMMHVGMRSGEIAAPGVWMMKQGGMMSFAGGLLGHVAYALAVVFVYNLF